MVEPIPILCPTTRSDALGLKAIFLFKLSAFAVFGSAILFRAVVARGSCLVDYGREGYCCNFDPVIIGDCIR